MATKSVPFGTSEVCVPLSANPFAPESGLDICCQLNLARLRTHGNDHKYPNFCPKGNNEAHYPCSPDLRSVFFTNTSGFQRKLKPCVADESLSGTPRDALAQPQGVSALFLQPCFLFLGFLFIFLQAFLFMWREKRRGGGRKTPAFLSCFILSVYSGISPQRTLSH